MKGKGFSVILSDMCPPVSGIPVKDASLSMELGVQAFSLAVGQAAISADAEQPADGSESTMDFEGLLLCGGNLVVKLLENEDLQGTSFVLSFDLFDHFPLSSCC